jgi:hypothetical protein
VSGIEYKAIPVGGVIDKAFEDGPGTVEAIVSVTGIVDNVNDIIMPGAYEDSLGKITPKGVWSHDWNQPTSRTISARELLPGDPQLPRTLPNGEPWPREAGALLVKMQFNLETQRGREAHSDVLFFGDQQEWSIGYKVPEGGATHEKADSSAGNVRKIHRLNCYEYSPVLFGAMPAARTSQGVKSAQLAFKSAMGTDLGEFMSDLRSMQLAAGIEAGSATQFKMPALMDPHVDNPAGEPFDPSYHPMDEWDRDDEDPEDMQRVPAGRKSARSFLADAYRAVIEATALRFKSAAAVVDDIAGLSAAQRATLSAIATGFDAMPDEANAGLLLDTIEGVMDDVQSVTAYAGLQVAARVVGDQYEAAVVGEKPSRAFGPEVKSLHAVSNVTVRVGSYLAELKDADPELATFMKGAGINRVLKAPHRSGDVGKSVAEAAERLATPAPDSSPIAQASRIRDARTVRPNTVTRVVQNASYRTGDTITPGTFEHQASGGQMMRDFHSMPAGRCMDVHHGGGWQAVHDVSRSFDDSAPHSFTIGTPGGAESHHPIAKGSAVRYRVRKGAAPKATSRDDLELKEFTINLDTLQAMQDLANS